MKCSACSKTVRPVVALDIDGTLGDYHNHFLQFARNWLPSPVLSTDFSNNLGLDLHTYRQVKLAYRQGGMKRTMPMFSYADELTALLRDCGVEIWVTTTRPYNRLDNIDPDTQEWLRRNNIQWDYVLYDPDKYEELAKLVDVERVVAVLEDLPEQGERAARLFGRGAVLMRHNGWTGTTGYTSLREAGYDIQKKIGEWYALHG